MAAIITLYIGPTNTKGGRVKAPSPIISEETRSLADFIVAGH